MASHPHRHPADDDFDVLGSYQRLAEAILAHRAVQDEDRVFDQPLTGPPDSDPDRDDLLQTAQLVHMAQTAQIRLQTAQLLHQIWTPPEFCLGCYIEACHLLSQWILDGTRAPNHQEPDQNPPPHPH